MKGIENFNPQNPESGEESNILERISNTRIGPFRERLPMFFSEDNRKIFCEEVFKAHDITDEQIDGIGEDVFQALTPDIASYFEHPTLEERQVVAKRIAEVVKNSL